MTLSKRRDQTLGLKLLRWWLALLAAALLVGLLGPAAQVSESGRLTLTVLAGRVVLWDACLLSWWGCGAGWFPAG